VVLALALTVQACGPANATSGPVGNRFFGMHAPALATAFPRAPVGAVNLTTNGVYWPQLEPTPGSYDFSRLDPLVDRAHANSAQPLLILGQTPTFHSTTPGAANVLASVPTMDAWKAYVSAVAARYRTRVDYQIWPEANISGNWTGTQAQLAKLVVAAAKIIHTKAPSAIVVSPAMVLRLRYQQQAMKAFFSAKVGGVPVGHYVNAVGIDAYPLQHGTPEDSAALIQLAHRILADHRVKAPLWNVEITYGVVGSHDPAPQLAARTQASYVVRTYLLNAAHGVRRVYWLGWARIAELGIQLVQSDGTTPTAAGRAYRVVHGWMAGQRVRGCARNSRTHVWTCTMVKSGRASWVYWINSGKAHVRAPKGARKVETMAGRTSSTRAGRTLTVTKAPIWVHH
jgi:hypothetical protein